MEQWEIIIQDKLKYYLCNPNVRFVISLNTKWYLFCNKKNTNYTRLEDLSYLAISAILDEVVYNKFQNPIIFITYLLYIFIRYLIAATIHKQFQLYRVIISLK